MTAPTDLEDDAAPVTVRTIQVVSMEDKEDIIHPAARRVAPLPGNYEYDLGDGFRETSDGRAFPGHFEPVGPLVHPHAVPNEGLREAPAFLPALRHTRDVPQTRSLRQTLDFNRGRSALPPGDEEMVSVEDRELHEEVSSISGRLSSPETGEKEEVRPSSSKFIRTTSHSRVASIKQPGPDEGWRCNKNFETSPTLDTMKVWPQVLVAMTAALSHFSLGTVLAYPAISLPQLTTQQLSTASSTTQPDYQSNNTADVYQEIGTVNYSQLGEPPPNLRLLENSANTTTKQLNGSTHWNVFVNITLSPSQAAWFASAHTVGAIMGSMMCGLLMSIFGQRRAILITAPITLASWLTIWLSPAFYLMVTARIASGICIGILGTSAQVYIVEIAHETVRGSLTCITDLFVGIGLLFTYVLGISGLGWRWAALTLGLTANVPLIVGLSLFPDSPRWLATKDRKEDAKNALMFLRGGDHDVSSELEKILRASSNRTSTTFCQQIAKLKDPVVYTPFLTGCGVFFFSQLSGPYVVYSYTVHIFQAAKVGLSPYLSTVLVGVARVVGSFIGIMVVERAGRRPAMLVGAVGTALSLISLGVYFFLQRDEEKAASIGWLALASMIVYTVILGATISPIPFLLSSELLPLSFRSVGSAATKGVFFLAGTLVTYTFPLLKNSVGSDVTFWLYSISAMVLVVLVWKRVPETKGRSLEAIEDYYKGMFAT